MFPVDELREHGVHRLVRALLRRARDHGPALGDTVNAARIASGAAQRCPVVHIGSPVPCAVPALLVCGAQGIVREAEQLLLHRRFAQRREDACGIAEKPAEPDAFSLSLDADAIHGVVPVAGTDERDAVRTEGYAANGAQTVIEQRRGVPRGNRLAVKVLASGGDFYILKVSNSLV